jgi:hypothetical protein
MLRLLLAAACLAGCACAVSFVSIGDWGGAGIDAPHKANQIAVAKAMAATAGTHHAAFVLNVGDNFY